MKRYAIVGFGCAGYTAARAMRQAGYRGEIHVFERTQEPPANPMLTTYYVSGKLPEKGAYPFGSLKDIAPELRLTLHSGAVVSRVCSEERTILLADGSEQAFDKILIATGARAAIPEIPGADSPAVFSMRTMEDARRLRARLEKGDVRRAVVVGASMVGIKVAELLRARGVETCIADFASWLFPLAAFENVARELERRVSDRGLSFKWNAAISSITPEGARFSDGVTLPADVVCLCIGTRANVDLVGNTEVAQGQNVVIRRGIVVDRHMQTGAPGIYAAGDCCEGINLQSGETMIIGLWANAASQGETAGRNMAGETVEYPGNIVHNITHFMDMDFIGLGDTRLTGTTICFGMPRHDSYVQAVVDAGRLRCINILGSYAISGVLKSLLVKRITDGEKELTDTQRGLLVREGFPEGFIRLLEGKE